jgi:uroporphyrinogen-III synthase
MDAGRAEDHEKASGQQERGKGAAARERRGGRGGVAAGEGAENRPLSGRRVVVARSEDRSEALRARLESLGAAVEIVPAIRHALVADLGHFAMALEKRERYSHVLFTSANAVRFFAEATRTSGKHPSLWSTLRVAVVGHATAEAAREAGLGPPVVVSSGGGSALADALVGRGEVGPGTTVLLPQSSIARPDLHARLEATGATVDAFAIYDTRGEDPAQLARSIEEILDRGLPDAIVLASPSAVDAILGAPGGAVRDLVARGRTLAVSIGPTTSEALSSAGLKVAAEAESPTAEAIASAVVDALKRIESRPAEGKDEA